jgi:hypothetical protein
MTDSELQLRIDELDADLTKDAAQILVYCEDIDQQSVELIGNRKGYLRAGVEMLKAAMVPMQPGDFITPIKIDYLIRSGRSLYVTRLTRQENVADALPPPRKNTWKEKAIGVGCLALVLFLVGCTFVGVGQVLSWIFGK